MQVYINQKVENLQIYLLKNAIYNKDQISASDSKYPMSTADDLDGYSYHTTATQHHSAFQPTFYQKISE